MESISFKRLELRVDSARVYLTAVLDVNGDEKKVDLTSAGKQVGNTQSIKAKDAAKRISDLLDKIPTRSTDLKASEAIERLEAGEELDLTGEDRVTVLEAANDANEAENQE